MQRMVLPKEIKIDNSVEAVRLQEGDIIAYNEETRAITIFRDGQRFMFDGDDKFVISTETPTAFLRDITAFVAALTGFGWWPASIMRGHPACEFVRPPE